MLSLLFNFNNGQLLAREGSNAPGSCPALTHGDNTTLSISFWEGSGVTLTNKRLTDIQFIKFGTKADKNVSSLLLYLDSFTEVQVGDNYYYRKNLSLNTVPLTGAMTGKDSLEVTSDVELTFLSGERTTFQFKHAIRQQVITNPNPPEEITEPLDIVFADMFAAYVDLNPGATMADFIDSIKSTIPGPAGENGYITGSAGAVDLDGGNYTLLSSDNGKLLFNTGAACTVTVPLGLPTGFVCEFLQIGGAITIAGGSGMTVGNSFGYTQTRSTFSACSLRVLLASLGITAGDML